MNRKKGFTLVELIIVIALLIIIAGIFSFNAIINLNKQRAEEKNNLIAQITSAADAFTSNNSDVVKNLYEGYGYVDITVGDLREAGLLSEDLKDPETGERVPDDAIVRVIIGEGEKLEFIYPPENLDQDAYQLIAKPLTIKHDPNMSMSEWCNDSRPGSLSTVYSGLVVNPGAGHYNEDLMSLLYIMDNTTGEMFNGDYFNSNGVDLRVDSCNVDPKKEGIYNVTYKYTDTKLGVSKTQNREVYVEASNNDVISFTAKINNGSAVIQNLPDNLVKVTIREKYRTNRGTEISRVIDTYVSELKKPGGEYSISDDFSTANLGEFSTVVRCNKTNSDGSTPEAQNVKYVVVPAIYDITFDPNGGTVSPRTKRVKHDEAYGSLPVPSRVGYTFKGWYTSTTGGEEITASKIVSILHGTIFYARWEANKYTVTFSANGGSHTSSEVSFQVTYDSSYGRVPSNPTRTGYTFRGWYTSSSGGSQITSNSIVKTASNHTIYAHWEGNPYNVGFNGNGGSPSYQSRTEYFGSYYTFPSTPYRTGYTFNGWYTSPSGGSYVSNSTIVNTARDHELYAHWSKIVYTINFYASGGSVSPSSIRVDYGESTGSLPTPTRRGYEFNGWYTSSNCYGTKRTGSYYPNSSETLYACWRAKSYTVTFNSNGGGSVSPSSKVVTYGSSYGSIPTPSRTNYRFDGWYTSSSGGTRITASSIVNTPNNHTLYAHWIANTITVSFNSNGGTGTYPTRIEQNIGQNYKMPTRNPTMCMTKFTGWFAQPDSGRTPYTTSTKVTVDYNHTLYAHYEVTPQTCSSISSNCTWRQIMVHNANQWIGGSINVASDVKWHTCSTQATNRHCGTSLPNASTANKGGTCTSEGGKRIQFCTCGKWFLVPSGKFSTDEKNTYSCKKMCSSKPSDVERIN